MTAKGLKDAEEPEREKVIADCAGKETGVTKGKMHAG
jgi:hypothetical protein